MHFPHRAGPKSTPPTNPSRSSGLKPLLAASALVATLVLGGFLSQSAQAAFIYHGTLLVANRGGSPPSILRIDTATDTVLQTITQTDVSDPNNAITDVQVDPVTGNIFVAVDLNGGNDDPALINVGGTGEVVVFDPFGVYLRTVPMPDDGPGSDTAEALHSPMGIDIDTDGSIWATLPASLQVIRVANNSLGTIQGQFDLSAAGARGPTDVHVSPTPGHVFVSDLDPNGEFAGQLFEVDTTTNPTTVTKRADGDALGPLPPAARPGDVKAGRFQFPTMAGGFMSVEIEGGALIVSTDDGRIAIFSPTGTGNGILLDSHDFGDGVASLDTVYDPDTDQTFVPRLFNGTIETPNGAIYTANGFAPDGPLMFPAGVAIAADPQASLRYNLETNIGSSCVGQSVTQTLTITNESANPVTVNDVFIQSGSSDFSVDPQPTRPFVLQPGGSAFFTIRFTPAAGETGEQNAVLRVTSTDPVEPVVNFNIRGTVLNPTISANQPANGVLAFGDVCPGVPESRFIQILNNGDCPATINNIQKVGGVNPDSITLDHATLPVTLQAGSTFLIDVTVNAQVTSGAISTTVRTNINDSAVNTDVAVTATVSPASIELSPASLNFGTVCAGSTQSRTLSIRNTGGCDLTVSNVAITAGGSVYSVEPVSTPLTIASGGSAPVTVTFAPSAVGADQTGVLTITSDTGGASGTTSNVPLTGDAPAGVLSASPAALDFGSLCVGMPATRSLQLRNTGPCGLTLTSASLAGPNAADYSVGSGLILPVSIPAGSSVTAQITVNPTVSSSAHSATLTLMTSDANTVAVALSTNVSAAPTVAVSGVSGAQSGDGTPANPYVVCVGASPAFTFTVTGTDPDAGDTVRLTQSGAPAGAAFTNVLPATGNPVATTVTFSPNAGQGGQSYSVTFTGTDNSAAACSDSATINIRVSSLPVISATPSTLNLCEGMPIEFRVRATDADAGAVSIGVPTMTSSAGAPPLNLVSTPGLPHSGNPAETVVTGVAPDVAADATYTLTYTATDSDGCTATQVVTVTVMDSAPTTLTMTRTPAGEIAVDQEVCFTAVVRDNCSEPRLVSGVPVCFSVVSSTGNDTLPAGVHVTTDANGEARYCLTPKFPGTVTVTAVIDFNGDCIADAGTAGATMNLTVAAPVQLGPGCYASGRGKVNVADPLFGTAPVAATFNFDVSPKRNGTFSGAMSFVTPATGARRRGNIIIRSTRIESMLCAEGPAGLTAVIFGTAKVTGHPDVAGKVRFRIDALDAGTPGIPNDRFTITLLNRDGDILAGPVGGNLQFGRLANRDDIKIRSGMRVR